MLKIPDKLIIQTGIEEENILKIYKAYWKFIKTKIEELPLKNNLSEEEFSKFKTNFNVPKLGKLVCTYQMYNRMCKIIENNKHVKYKESKTDG